MKRYLVLARFILTVFILISLIGCSKQENSVSKQYALDNWDVVVSLSWDKDNVIGQIKPKYTGDSKLDYVVVKPNFTVKGWPEGYIPPSSGIYTWNSEKPEGAIPDVMETSTRSNSILSKQPPRTMTQQEANVILERVSVLIEWKVNEGELLSITVNPGVPS